MAPTDAHSDADEGSKSRHVPKKLQKRRPMESITSDDPDMPERLRRGDDAGEEDLTMANQGPTMYMDMNQSIFGLIAAAGHRLDFTDRFHPQSSDEEDDDDDDDAPPPGSRTTLFRRQAKSPKADDKKHHRRKISDHKLLRSLPALPRLAKSRLKKERSKTPASPTSPESDADDSVSHASDADNDKRYAPVMSRMLEARAEMAARPSFDLERLSGEVSRDSASGELGISPLAKKLKDIFEFEEAEEVIEEYPCWLLQCVLLQGFMYITTKHICFYAYLPKKANEVTKSGYLSKSGKRNPKYNRYWFRLKGDVLSYFADTTNVYFPHGQIDLRYAISANVTDKEKGGTHFSVTTHHRTYYLKADSAPSAKEWVKAIQRVIFRSHNDGDSVKISLPIENIIDIEEMHMLEFADTCKIRVLDNDETFVLDEYYFSFFNHGKEAINVLKILVDDAASRQKDMPKISVLAHRQNSPQEPPEMVETTLPRDTVRATLVPHSPTRASPRVSGDVSRTSFDAFKPFSRSSIDQPRSSQDIPRRSFSGAGRSMSQSRQTDAKGGSPWKHGASSESYVHSVDEPSVSALVMSSSDDPSASQILKGSDVFQSPTIRRSTSSSRLKSRGGDKTPGARPPLSPPPKAFGPKHAASTGNLTSATGHDMAGGPQAPNTPTLQQIAKMGSYPLQRAGAFANYLNSTSRKMSSLLASESMGYVEKVSGMWKGGRKHYEQPQGLRTDDDEDDDDDSDDEKKRATANERFRAHFALPETEKLQSVYFGHLFRVLPLYGKIYISDQNLCFRSLLIGTRTKLILPLRDIENVNKEKGFTFGYSGLVLVIRGHEELFFEFNRSEIRDDCTVTLLRALEKTRYLKDSAQLPLGEERSAEAAKAERDALQEERHEDENRNAINAIEAAADGPPILFGDMKTSLLDFKPATPLRITCLTIGSRGDVQPYIALCKGLMAEGHKARIATHGEFQGWVESHGIEFAKVEGDPGELMRLCIEHGTFTWSFLKEANSMFRGWLDDLLASSWVACQGSDLLIESPSAMAGIHIAEALGIPYFRAFTMPWTRTRAYPHAFVMPETKMGGAYNVTSYVLFDNVFWKATAYQINRWRRNTLKLPNTSLEKMQPNKVPFMYNFSPSVVAPPIDFSDWIRVTGYWFLDEGKDFKPPQDLADFIAKARADGKKIVYVGFGSIIVKNPAKMTQEVIDAVLAADVRCILSKGWSDRPTNGGPAVIADEPALPPEIFVIKSAPHDWLFTQIDAAAHHGGSGTTGASLRAGIPTIIRPFFGDQFFFGSRVEDLGVGIYLRKWGSNSFGRALWEATHNERLITRAKSLGQRIRKENGVETAIQCIYRDLEYAKSLIKRKPKEGEQGKDLDDDDEGEEESWTFVGRDEPDPEVLTRRLSDLWPGPGSDN
ncbi:hypothetical protein jhhlp_001621 [Lomentospora prolificans]|uniref:Sterol 3-beta-glucosyltransferase n=1 Tax=Lomentospora prolificans TaxID=41688 RepID=A0A2N3NIT0_9PEZI|nr:hypothetical protein jhhlp_001621 [Lomentospora prolificans]